MPRYAEEQNVRMQRDAECRAMALLEDAGVSAAAGDPHPYQQLLVGSVSHKVLPSDCAESRPSRPRRIFNCTLHACEMSTWAYWQEYMYT